MIARIRYVACAVAALSASATVAAAKPMTIMSAAYGTIQTGRVCDATPMVANLCTGRGSCIVNVGNLSLCGDPDFLSVKAVSIRYKCGRSIHDAVVGEYTTAQLVCE